MTVEELRDKLSLMIKKNPDIKDVEVMIRYWDDYFNDIMHESVVIVELDDPKDMNESVLAVSGEVSLSTCSPR